LPTIPESHRYLAFARRAQRIAAIPQDKAFGNAGLRLVMGTSRKRTHRADRASPSRYERSLAMKHHPLRLLVLVCLFCALSGFAQTQDPQQAQDDQQSQEVEKLKEKLRQLEQTIQDLKGQFSAIEQQKPKTGSAAQQPAKPQKTVTIKTGPPVPTEGPSGMLAKPKKDEKSTFQIYGFAMLDVISDLTRRTPTGTTFSGQPSCRRSLMSFSRAGISTSAPAKRVSV
jgi:hypothetical protein